MTTTTKSQYGTSAQAITCTLASLASGSARGSTAIDNTTNLFLDSLVTVKIKTGATGSVAADYVAVYAFATTDGGASYSEGFAGTDGAFSGSVSNLRLVGIIACPAATTTYTMVAASVAAAFGGVLPDHWGIVVLNKTSAALDATEGNHTKQYQGAYAQNV